MSLLNRLTRQIAFVIAVFTVVFGYVLFALHPTSVGAQEDIDVEKRRAALQIELIKIENEIGVQEDLVNGKKKERVSLERDITILEGQINKAKLEIRQRDLTITGLEDDIFGKVRTVEQLEDTLDRQKDSLAQLIRKTNQIDDYSLVEIVLATENISDFFQDLDSFESIKRSLHKSFRAIELTKKLARKEQESLEDKRFDELELLRLQELQKARIEDREDEKQQILGVTKGQEASYEYVLNKKKKTAAEIRTALFQLRGSAAIPYDKALKYAREASAITGVRPAMLLATFEQESNLGENVGTGNYRDDMHPTRDVPVFLEITARLGLNPESLPVSKKPWYGWGGAMGPAQFIPSTWILYEDRIGRASGQEPPNPWEARTAFFASALLLSDNGADRGTYAAERLAALRYFAGWKNAEKASYAFYGDGVMELVEKHQGLIDILEGN